MKVSIVIPNWNGRELLREFFPSVVAAADHYRSQTNHRIEILLVDDASTDDSREWLQNNYGENDLVRIFENEKNLGFLRTVNRGFEAATGDLVFLLNNDVQAELDSIEPLTKHFDDPDVFAVCCRAGRINSERLDGGGKIGRFERGFWRVFLNYEAIPAEVNVELISFYGSGGYTMYDREKWRQLGGFQDCLAPIYWEDVEICYRAWKRGWKVLFEPKSRVRHLGSATMGKKPMRAEMSIVTERNRLLMTWINLHDRGMLLSHFAWLALKLTGSALSLRWNYLRSFSRALGLLTKVRAARGIEKMQGSLTDANLAQKFDEIVKKPGVYVVATEADEIAFAEKRDILNGRERAEV
jgi:GT2 family glycosyltransferase